MAAKKSISRREWSVFSNAGQSQALCELRKCALDLATRRPSVALARAVGLAWWRGKLDRRDMFVVVFVIVVSFSIGMLAWRQLFQKVW